MGRPRKSGRTDWPTGMNMRVFAGKKYYYFDHPKLVKEIPLGSDLKLAKEAARGAYMKLAVSASDKIINAVVGYIKQSQNPGSQHTLQVAFDMFMQQDMLNRKSGRADTAVGRSDKTIRDYNYTGARFAGELTEKYPKVTIGNCTKAQCVEWLDSKKPTYSKNARALLIQFFDFATKKDWREDNPIEKTFKANVTVQTKRLTRPQYDSIYNIAEPWMQAAMNFSIRTLQRREDLVLMRKDHIQDGILFISQLKVQRHETGDLAFYIWPELQQAINQCLTLAERDSSPFLLAREPERQPRGKKALKKQHPFQISDDMLTKTFQDLRDRLIDEGHPAWSAFKAFSRVGSRHEGADGRPPWRELRSFGAWSLQAELGWDAKSIEGVLGHAEGKESDMTAEYLSGYGKKSYRVVREPTIKKEASAEIVAQRAG